MFNASIHLSLWTEFFWASIYLINRTLLSTLSFKSPYEVLFLRTPNYNDIRILRCWCFPCLRDYRKHKFNVKSFPCVFIGYSPLHKGYRCLNHQTKHVYISRHVIFNESVFPFDDNNSLISPMQETRHIMKFPSYDKWLELTSAAPISQDTKSNHTTCHAHTKKECLGISNSHAIPPQMQMPLAQAVVPRLSTLIFGSPVTLSSIQPQNVPVAAPIDK